MWLPRLQITNTYEWHMKIAGCLSPCISLDFWSNSSSLNDRDSECHTAWFEAAEPNMIDFCFSLDVISGSWKNKGKEG